MSEPKKPTLRDAWMALNQYCGSAFRDWDDECFRLLIDTAERLVDLYDNHELASADSSTSAADDAAALYEVLNAARLPVA